MALTAAHKKIRQLYDRSQLSMAVLARVLGLSRQALENHLAGGIISKSRADWYMSIRTIEVGEFAVHLVVDRPQLKRKKRRGL